MRRLPEFAPTFQLAMRLRGQVRRQAREVTSLEQRLIAAHRRQAELCRHLDDERVKSSLLYELADPVLRDLELDVLAGLRGLRSSSEGPRSAP